MSLVIDNIVAYKVLYMLVTPFVDTDAYKLGIIDENGNNLIKPSKFTSGQQKEAYTYLHRLVFNMKKILTKLPGGDNKLKSIVAALYLIREYHQTKDKSYSIMEDRLNSILKSNAVLIEETIIAEKWLSESIEYCNKCDKIKEDCTCKEVKEDAPANSTGAAVSTDRAVIAQKDINKYKLKNAGSLKFVKRN